MDGQHRVVTLLLLLAALRDGMFLAEDAFYRSSWAKPGYDPGLEESLEGIARAVFYSDVRLAARAGRDWE